MHIKTTLNTKLDLTLIMDYYALQPPYGLQEGHYNTTASKYKKGKSPISLWFGVVEDV